MKAYHYIDEDNAEQLDLIRLFEYAFEDVIIALSKLQKHITIKTKQNENS